MCTNYVPAARHELAAMAPGVVLPEENWPQETYPGYGAPILTMDALGTMHCRIARFGLVPRWCKTRQQAQDIARMTYNARSETAPEKPSFRDAWLHRQWAVAPLQSYFEPCWEEAHLHGGKAVRWQMARPEGHLWGAAGLWEQWVSPQEGDVLHSFTLLTVNADGHSVMGRMHKPGEEKRMPVLLAPDQFADWLKATPASAHGWMQRWPASDMTAVPAPRAMPPSQRKARVASAADDSRNLSLF